MLDMFNRGLSALLLGVWLFLTSLQLAAAPSSYEYYILNPRIENGALSVISLANRNTIQAGTTTLTLNRYQTGSIPVGPDLTPGMLISATGSFTLGSEVDATDLPVPGNFIGTKFVIPHLRNDHTYYILSPQADAQVTITLSGVSTVVTALKGQVLTFPAGSTNSISGLIQSDQPILVAHAANGGIYDVYPVPPAARELWGVRSNNAIVGAMENNTTITVTGSSGATESFTLNAGGYRTLTVPSGAQGSGSAVHIVADKPIAAIQSADSDGAETTAFLDTPYLATHYGLPINTQYVAVVCPQFTNVTLTNGTVTETQSCAGDGTQPGKAYFGSITNGTNINAGAHIEADHPVYIYYEASATNDEHNITGRKDDYYSLNPRFQSGPLSAMSLVDNNWITAGNSSLFLNQNERGTIPGSELLPGTEIWGTGPFTLGGEVDGTDLPVPGSFAGTTFIIPHARDTQTYYLFSPYGEATVSIDIGGTVSHYTLAQDQVVNINAGSDTTTAGIIKSDRPILVSHQGGTSGDAYPVPPAATELWGIRSTSAQMAAVENNTTVRVYSSDAQIATYTLNAGVRQSINIGANTSQGQGAALHLIADKPIAAYQLADSDGYEATAFLQRAYHATRFGLPIDTQYVAVVCPTSGTRVTLYESLKTPATQTCSGIGDYPGKLYFGSATNGTNISAGAYLNADHPIYVIYEASATNDEHNLLGYNALTAPDPSAPVLNTLPATAHDNPLAVTGRATPNMDVRLYVNGTQQATTKSSATDGSFSFSAALIDGSNEIYATTWDGSQESHHSTPVTVTYTNTLSRTWNNSTISTNTVWTPGSTPALYNITGPLTVASGATLTLQPGVTLKFGSGSQLLVQTGSTLVVRGETGNNVTLTGASPTRGSWKGVFIDRNSTGNIIENAIIKWANKAIDVHGGRAIIKNNIISDFYYIGISLSYDAYGNGAYAYIFNNVIDNHYVNGGTGIYSNGIFMLGSSTSANIERNIIKNTDMGFYIAGATAQITNGNRITDNKYGFDVLGGRSVITGNSIYNNGSGNFFEVKLAAGTALDASGNWWGFSDLYGVASAVGSFMVNFGHYLDADGGQPVPGHYIYGDIDDTTWSLIAGETYIVIAPLTIPVGKTMTVPAGVKFNFMNNIGMTVNGNLIVNGSKNAFVTFSSVNPHPSSGNWSGIRVNGGGTVSINYSVIEYAHYGIEFNSGAGTVTNSLIRLNRQGIYIHVMYVQGIYVNGLSSPEIKSNRIVYNASDGIILEGTGDDKTNPQPVIVGNDIYGNGSQGIFVNGFGAGSKIILNLTGNWWGADPPVLGKNSFVPSDIFVPWYDIPISGVNYSGYATAPLSSPVFFAFTISDPYISPNADGNKDTTTISASISVLANWTLTITDATNTVIRSFMGTGNQISQRWDGMNASGQTVADGVYRVVIQAAGAATGKTVYPLSGMITVNTVAPTAVISFPSTTGVVSNTISINGTTKSAITNGDVTYTVDYALTTSPGVWTVIKNGYLVTNANLATWATNLYRDQVLIPNGTYLIRLTVRDTASGTVATDQVTVTLDNMLISNVVRTHDVINPSKSETALINFDINQPADVTVRIVPESSALKVYPDQTPESDAVRTIHMGTLAAGRQTVSWDGRDDAGNIVNDDGYIYVIEATSPTGRFDKFNAYVSSTGGVVEPVIDSSSITPYDPYKNKFISPTFAAQNTAFRGSFRIQYTDSSGQLTTLWPVHQAVWPPGSNAVFWDGRDDNGNIATDIQSITYYISGPGTSTSNPTIVKSNYIIVQGGKPDVPGISLKSDPYLIYLSYGQVTRLHYTLADAANVTVTVKNPVTGVETVLLNKAQTVGNYTVPWDGQGNNGGLVPGEGHYTFAITATNPATGLSTVRRGNITVFQ